jgi:hypothetical protein
MHILRMVVEHVVVCKAVDFALHQVWLLLKRAFDAVVNAFSLFLFASFLKELDRIQRGLAGFFLLAAMGALSTVTLGLQAQTAKVR